VYRNTAADKTERVAALAVGMLSLMMARTAAGVFSVMVARMVTCRSGG
jgi:hypothetical protein